MNFDNELSAMEAILNPEKSVADLLDDVRANVASEVTTIDAAASLENKLSEEAAQFNACLTTMSNAIRKCESGEISRDEMLAECAPCVSALKEKCIALKLANVEASDNNDITEDEIAMLREFIVGCKDIVAERHKELQDDPIESINAIESFIDAEMEPANEASLKHEIRYSTESKTADELLKQAKRMYSLGNKEKAKDYLAKAKKLYEACLKKTESYANMIAVKRTAYKSNVGNTVSIKDSFEKKVTENRKLAELIEHYEDRIDSCRALELQWQNKAGANTYRETKEMLKAERREARAAKRESMKAAMAAKFNKSGGESIVKENYYESAVEALGMEPHDFIEAMESMMDSIELGISMEAAMEAEGEEASAPKAGGIFKRMRSGMSKLRKADTASELAEAKKEVKEAAEELEEAADAAETPEEKKRLSLAAQGALAGLGAVLIAGGLYGAGKACKNSSEKKHNNPKGVARLLIKYVNGIDNSWLAKKSKNAVNRVGGKIEAKKNMREDRSGNHSLANAMADGRSKARGNDDDVPDYIKHNNNIDYNSALDADEDFDAAIESIVAKVMAKAYRKAAANLE